MYYGMRYVLVSTQHRWVLTRMVVIYMGGYKIMSKQVYISADYDQLYGDRNVVEELNKWGSDSLHKVDFIDMSKVSSGTVANGDDCRICDLKAEFNRQINASSAVIFVVGNQTGSRTAGSGCERMSKKQWQCYCTPYKQNANGMMLGSKALEIEP